MPTIFVKRSDGTFFGITKRKTTGRTRNGTDIYYFILILTIRNWVAAFLFYRGGNWDSEKIMAELVSSLNS